MIRLLFLLFGLACLPACRRESAPEPAEPPFDRKALMFAIRDNDAAHIATLGRDSTSLRLEHQSATLTRNAFRTRLDSFLQRHPVQRFYEMETTPAERRRGLDLCVWFTDGKDDFKMLFDLKDGRIDALEIRRL